MKLFKLSLIIQIIKNPQIPKLNYENLEKLKKYNERFLTFWELGCLDDVGFCNFWFGYIYKSKGGLTSELTNLIYIYIRQCTISKETTIFHLLLKQNKSIKLNYIKQTLKNNRRKKLKMKSKSITL